MHSACSLRIRETQRGPSAPDLPVLDSEKMVSVMPHVEGTPFCNYTRPYRYM